MYCPKCYGYLKQGKHGLYCGKCLDISVNVIVFVVFLFIDLTILTAFINSKDDTSVGLSVFTFILLSIPTLSIFIHIMNKLKQRCNFQGVNYIMGFIKHYEGLPMVSGVMVKMIYWTDKIFFIKENQEIILETSKIISVDVVQGKNAKNEAMLGAAAGALMVDGLYGAIYGRMLANHFYFVIAYKSDEGIKYITLDTEGTHLPYRQIVSEIKRNIPQTSLQVTL